MTVRIKCKICEVGDKEANKNPELRPKNLSEDVIKNLCKIHKSNYNCATSRCGGYH